MAPPWNPRGKKKLFDSAMVRKRVQPPPGCDAALLARTRSGLRQVGFTRARATLRAVLKTDGSFWRVAASARESKGAFFGAHS